MYVGDTVAIYVYIYKYIYIQVGARILQTNIPKHGGFPIEKRKKEVVKPNSTIPNIIISMGFIMLYKPSQNGSTEFKVLPHSQQTHQVYNSKISRLLGFVVDIYIYIYMYISIQYYIVTTGYYGV